MKIACLAIVVCFVCFSLVEASIEAGTYRIPEDVIVQGIRVVAGSYGIRIEESSEPPAISIVKGNEVLATVPAILLPARGLGETSIATTRAGKQDYVRLRIRSENHWYIAYLPTQHLAPGTQH